VRTKSGGMGRPVGAKQFHRKLRKSHSGRWLMVRLSLLAARPCFWADLQMNYLQTTINLARLSPRFF
jgi:hypothetical protein